jgi:hypothetical protein
MFEAAKTAPVKKATKGKGKAKQEITIAGLADLATIKTIEKALAGLSATIEVDVKANIASMFVATADGKKPANFTGIEGAASASCELRKRSSRSALSVEEQELLATYNISTDVIEDVTEAFVINTKYKNDQALLARVSEALKGVEGMPADFITHQAQQARVVTAASSLDEIFLLENTATAELLSVVGTLAIKPKMSDVADAIANLNDIIG